MWISSSTYNNATECKQMVAPDSPNQIANILKITFLNDSTSTPPILTAYDNSSLNSTQGQIFGGEPGRKDSKGTNYTPWLKAIETTNTIPSQNWIKGTDATSNITNCNALSSTLYAVTCSSIADANESKLFALACAIPSDAIQGDHEWVFTLEYTFS